MKIWQIALKVCVRSQIISTDLKPVVDAPLNTTVEK